MAENTGIAWTDHTHNPWIGCTAVSPACDHCYAETLVKRWGGDFATRRRTAPANWRKPLTWNKAAEKAGVRRRVFCASLADVFDNKADPAWRADLWTLIRACPALDWQLLTKRPQNIAKMLPDDWGQGWPNVWLGCTAEKQVEADRRIPHLLAVPAVVRFLSVEPMLEPVRPALDGIGWVIVGGESGHGARPMPQAWAADLLCLCAAAGVPAFFKQTGSNRYPGDWPNGITGKGDNPAQWPEAARVQQFPKATEPHHAA